MPETAKIGDTEVEIERCTKHPGVGIKFMKGEGCPLCIYERKVSNLKHRISGDSKTTYFRFDEEHIPQILDNAVNALEGLRHDLQRLTDVIEQHVNLSNLEQSTRSAEADGVPRDEFGDPLCPKCGKTMLKKDRRDGSGSFWGCPDFHTGKCNGTRNLDGSTKRKPQSSFIPDTEDEDGSLL